jgi:protein involved in polysaccharide export with SLBB domain
MNLKRIVFLGLILVGGVLLSLPAVARATGPAIPGVGAVPFSPSPLSGLTSDQVNILFDAAQKGQLTPEAQAILDANPALKQYLPAPYRAILEMQEVQAAGGEKPAGTDNVVKGKDAKSPTLPISLGKLVEGKFLVDRYDWRKSPYISRLFLSRLQKEESDQLTHFGHALFDQKADSTGVPDLTLPIPEDYVIGPGDEISVRIWGRMESTHLLRVDRDGKIYLPKFGGPLYVAGKTFKELRSYIKQKVESVPQVYADVSMGQIRGFQVTTLGEVKTPGRYRITSFQTVLHAIWSAGGIRDIGSFRKIQVKRGKETAAEIDLYEYLLKGDTSQDERLHGGDGVFVPVVGPLVAVTGEVRRPAIYELKGERTVGEVLAMAGGISPAAYRLRVQVERLEGNASRVVVEFALEEGGRERATYPVQDGDILRILPILPVDENVVRVEGNVYRPGKFEWKAGLTVGGLIPDEKFFLPDTFLDYALLIRLVGPEKRKELIPVNLRKIVIERDKSADVPLMPFDNLTVYPETSFRDMKKATVVGEVRNPGTYVVYPGMRVSDLVKSAGDFTRNAYPEEAELSRVDGKKEVKVLKVLLSRALAGDGKENLLVEDQDTLAIRQVPDLPEVRFITIAGEVRSPGMYAARKEERLSSIIRRAGGFTDTAFLKGAIFTRVSVQKREQKIIERTVEDLEQEIARTAVQAQYQALDREEIEAQRQIFEARKALLAKLKQVKPQGRVIIRITPPETMEGTENDLLVEDGDRLEIPRPPEVITVLGRVYNPNGVAFNKANPSAGYYLDKVGGPTKDADRKDIFVVRADGSVFTNEQAGGKTWLYDKDKLLQTPLEPGDTIVVPEKLVYTRFMKDVKDITQILYQIAVTIGVLFVIF